MNQGDHVALWVDGFAELEQLSVGCEQPQMINERTEVNFALFRCYECLRNATACGLCNFYELIDVGGQENSFEGSATYFHGVDSSRETVEFSILPENLIHESVWAYTQCGRFCLDSSDG